MVGIDRISSGGINLRTSVSCFRPPKLAIGMLGILLLLTVVPACQKSGMPRILDDGSGRKLLIDGRLRAYVDTALWESRLKYVAVMNLPMRFFSRPGRMLLIGLGAGSIVKNYTKEHWGVETAEPDTLLTGLARRFFGLKFHEGMIHAIDGRDFLASRPDHYDIILEDLVGTRAVPARLMSTEFFEAVRTHLEPGGIFGISFESAGWHDEALRTVAATIRESFANVSVLPVAEPPNRFGSIVVIASNTAHDDLLRDVDRNADLEPEWRFGPRYQETHAWDNRFLPPPEPQEVQTDARNVLERLFRTLDDSARAQPPDYLP